GAEKGERSWRPKITPTPLTGPAPYLGNGAGRVGVGNHTVGTAGAAGDDGSGDGGFQRPNAAFILHELQRALLPHNDKADTASTATRTMALTLGRGGKPRARAEAGAGAYVPAHKIHEVGRENASGGSGLARDRENDPNPAPNCNPDPNPDVSAMGGARRGRGTPDLVRFLMGELGVTNV
ncbi:unnamed protein product, partial [Discosporangium mesarthrocarpum]